MYERGRGRHQGVMAVNPSLVPREAYEEDVSI